MEVAVLGCGPAGLLVATAVEQAGHRPVIFSKKEKSKIPGSLHLRAAIPGVTGVYPDNTVTIVRMGSAEDYARKVYGDPARPTGWEDYASVYPSWNAVKAYDDLWERYAASVRDLEITIDTLRSVFHQYEKVISTIPQQTICQASSHHFFDGQPYWIKPLPTQPEDAGRELIVYNGLREDHWYRWSILGDRCSMESTSFMDESLAGVKPVYTNCNCWPGLIRAGRWAEWRHGVLLNHAYYRAKEAMEK